MRTWASHPVTERFHQILREHRDAHIAKLLNLGTINADSIGDLAQLKGQINTIDYILDIETLFEGEFEHEELQTITRENHS